MARFIGKVGYAVSVETAPDIYEDIIKERRYRGKYLNDTISRYSENQVNEDVSFSSRISIVADAYSFEHYSNIKYVVDSVGVYWEVNSIQLNRPRLILSTGGIYNGRKP